MEFNQDVGLFYIGRLNPPHVGHLSIIEKMLIYANDRNIPNIYVLLSHTHFPKKDPQKNPLPCNLKKEFLQKMVDSKFGNHENYKHININLICLDDEKLLSPEGKPTSFLGAIKYVLSEHHYNNVIIFLGEDRATAFGYIQKNLNGDGINVDFEITQRPEHAVSATEIRGYVFANDKSGFVEKMIQSGLNHEQAEELFEHINSQLRIKGFIGGKRIKRKTYKKSKRRKTKKHKKCKKSKKCKSKKTKRFHRN